MEKVSMFIPASVANVSCGFDVLGFCLKPVGDEMIIRKIKKPGITITKITGQDLPTDIKKNVAGVAAKALLSNISVNCGFEIEIYKGIKAGSGIGSSAASAAGAVFGINHLLGNPFTSQQLIKFAMEGERIASGTAHADNVSPVILGGFTLVRSINPLDVIKLPCPSKLKAVVLHPKIELKTIHAREILKNNISLEKAIKQWGNLAGFISALYTENYNLMSRCLVDEIVEPVRSMLIPKFNSLKKSALKSGALGFGISGSGPSVYALVKGSKRAKNVSQSMKLEINKIGLDFEIYISSIDNQGIKIISD